MYQSGSLNFGRSEINHMSMSTKHIQSMPKCLDKECVNGFVFYDSKYETIQKICKKCEKIEKDLMESEDYEVTIINGRAVGYEIIT